jgi:simple sugar transport system substrate-binding protein
VVIGWSLFATGCTIKKPADEWEGAALKRGGAKGRRNIVKRLLSKWAVASVVTTASALGAVVAHAQDKKITVAIHGQVFEPFWSSVTNGATQAGNDHGVTVNDRAPETFDTVAMSQLIDVAVPRHPAGPVVIPDADTLGPLIKRAVA